MDILKIIKEKDDNNRINKDAKERERKMILKTIIDIPNMSPGKAISQIKR